MMGTDETAAPPPQPPPSDGAKEEAAGTAFAAGDGASAKPRPGASPPVPAPAADGPSAAAAPFPAGADGDSSPAPAGGKKKKKEAAAAAAAPAQRKETEQVSAYDHFRAKVADYIELFRYRFKGFMHLRLVEDEAGQQDLPSLLEKNLTRHDCPDFEDFRDLVNMLYYVNPKMELVLRDPFAKAAKLLRIGVVETLPALPELITVVGMPHFSLPDDICQRLDRFYKRAQANQQVDLFDALRVFGDLEQWLKDNKCRDVVWFAVVAHTASLAPYVTSTENVARWPSLLRNMQAHHQMKFVYCMFSGFNIDTHGNKNWELTVEKDPFIHFFAMLFEDVVALASRRHQKHHFVRPTYCRAPVQSDGDWTRGGGGFGDRDGGRGGDDRGFGRSDGNWTRGQALEPSDGASSLLGHAASDSI